MGDGTYNGHPVSQAVLDKTPDVQVLVPLHKRAAPSITGDTQQDRHIESIVQRGRSMTLLEF
jgi:hypothetical protein